LLRIKSKVIYVGLFPHLLIWTCSICWHCRAINQAVKKEFQVMLQK